MNIQGPGGGRLDAFDMRIERQGIAALQRSDHIAHLQLTAMVKMDAWPEEKAPVGGRQLLPVVGNISFQFPIFLIYPRQRAEYLPGDMGFRTSQRAAGQ